MKNPNLFLAGLLGLAVSAASSAQPVPIVGLVELSGTGATAGTNFDNGVEGGKQVVIQTLPPVSPIQ
jgi:hypothetical protein